MGSRGVPTDLNDYLFEIIDQAQHGISVTDPHQPDNPLVFVNHAFVTLFGYSREELLGRNCRLLQGDDREQTGIDRIRECVKQVKTGTVVLRNYSKQGKVIYIEVTVSPIFDKDTGVLKYFLGIQKDVTREQVLIRQLQKII